MTKMNLKIKPYRIKVLMNSKIVLYILVNGKMEIDTGAENNIGMMEVYMKAIGEIVFYFYFF